jgi:hypothetical protein
MAKGTLIARHRIEIVRRLVPVAITVLLAAGALWWGISHRLNLLEPMAICDLLKPFDERLELGKYSLQRTPHGVSCKSHDITEQNADLVIETRWKPALVFELTGNRSGQRSRKNLVGALSLHFDILVTSRFLSRVIGLLDTLVDARLQTTGLKGLVK